MVFGQSISCPCQPCPFPAHLLLASEQKKTLLPLNKSGWVDRGRTLKEPQCPLVIFDKVNKTTWRKGIQSQIILAIGTLTPM